MNFSIATNHGRGKKQRTEWHKCVAWEKAGEIVRDYAQKGTKMFVRGELRTRKWTDQSGNEKYSTEIHVGGFGTQVRILSDGVDRKDENNSSSDKSTDAKTEENYDDEIPF